jgi:hypothetical protein
MRNVSYGSTNCLGHKKGSHVINVNNGRKKTPVNKLHMYMNAEGQSVGHFAILNKYYGL